MKAFRTLRGFLNGGEPDEPDYFAYSATLRVFGDHLDLDEISRRIGIQPTRFHRKGEKQGLRSPGFKHDLWWYSPPIAEDRPLEEHINALWEQIRPARDYLVSLKQIATVDVFLGYRSNIDDDGVQASLDSHPACALLPCVHYVTVFTTNEQTNSLNGVAFFLPFSRHNSRQHSATRGASRQVGNSLTPLR